ncbi:MAG TPA: hypothetical protein EYP53_05580 [Candidatus Latescibacteria bacterium]|nr:hypothetical protein [Candidatus Latescibacterota bacterium]
MGREEDLLKRLEDVAEQNGRYRREAYLFVYAALEYTLNTLPERRHITGRELLEGISQYARKLYGGLAKTVFNHWGIGKTEDFGQIVFNLVDAGLMSKTEEDSIDDFKNVYDFEEEFD